MSESLAYIRPHPRPFEAAGVQKNHTHIEERIQAIQEPIDQILRFSTSFVSESARLAQD